MDGQLQGLVPLGVQIPQNILCLVVGAPNTDPGLGIAESVDVV